MIALTVGKMGCRWVKTVLFRQPVPFAGFAIEAIEFLESLSIDQGNAKTALSWQSNSEVSVEERGHTPCPARKNKTNCSYHLG